MVSLLPKVYNKDGVFKATLNAYLNSEILDLLHMPSGVLCVLHY